MTLSDVLCAVAAAISVLCAVVSVVYTARMICHVRYCEAESRRIQAKTARRLDAEAARTRIS